MAEDSTSPASPSRPPTDVPLVHFTTRHLLLFVAWVSVVCMVLVSLEGYSVVIFSVGTILVAGHVLSTAIGSRLRAAADATRQWELEQTPRSAEKMLRTASRPELPRPSQLQVRTTCSSLLWWFVGTAMVCGGLLGAEGLQRIAGPNLGWPGLAIGALSAAMVVGWVAFIVAGICGIARRSWRGTACDAKDKLS